MKASTPPYSYSDVQAARSGASDQSSPQTWDMVIKPQGALLDFRFSELWRYRDLILLFVRRDFVARYKQTVLGPLWYLIQPLLTTITFTIVFGNIAGISTDGLPKFLFYMAGNITWTYFAACLTSTSNTFVTNRSLFGKVYFPRLAIPVSNLITNIFAFGIQLLFFLLFMAYYALNGAQIYPNSWILLTPLLLLLMAALGLALGMIASSLTSKYRDLTQLVAFGTSLFMYATPVIYPLSSIPEKYRLLLLANPVTPIVESFRYAFLGSGTVDVDHLLYAVVFTTVVLLVGLVLFHRVERNFMDTV